MRFSVVFSLIFSTFLMFSPTTASATVDVGGIIENALEDFEISEGLTLQVERDSDDINFTVVADEEDRATIGFTADADENVIGFGDIGDLFSRFGDADNDIGLVTYGIPSTQTPNELPVTLSMPAQDGDPDTADGIALNTLYTRLNNALIAEDSSNGSFAQQLADLGLDNISPEHLTVTRNGDEWQIVVNVQTPAAGAGTTRELTAANCQSIEAAITGELEDEIEEELDDNEYTSRTYNVSGLEFSCDSDGGTVSDVDKLQEDINDNLAEREEEEDNLQQQIEDLVGDVDVEDTLEGLAGLNASEILKECEKFAGSAQSQQYQECVKRVSQVACKSQPDLLGNLSNLLGGIGNMGVLNFLDPAGQNSQCGSGLAHSGNAPKPKYTPELNCAAGTQSALANARAINVVGDEVDFKRGVEALAHTFFPYNNKSSTEPNIATAKLSAETYKRANRNTAHCIYQCGNTVSGKIKVYGGKVRFRAHNVPQLVHQIKTFDANGQGHSFNLESVGSRVTPELLRAGSCSEDQVKTLSFCQSAQPGTTLTGFYNMKQPIKSKSAPTNLMAALRQRAFEKPQIQTPDFTTGTTLTTASSTVEQLLTQNGSGKAYRVTVNQTSHNGSKERYKLISMAARDLRTNKPEIEHRCDENKSAISTICKTNSTGYTHGVQATTATEEGMKALQTIRDAICYHTQYGSTGCEITACPAAKNIGSDCKIISGEEEKVVAHTWLDKKDMANSCQAAPILGTQLSSTATGPVAEFLGLLDDLNKLKNSAAGEVEKALGEIFEGVTTTVEKALEEVEVKVKPASGRWRND